MSQWERRWVLDVTNISFKTDHVIPPHFLIYAVCVSEGSWKSFLSIILIMHTQWISMICNLYLLMYSFIYTHLSTFPRLPKITAKQFIYFNKHGGLPRSEDCTSVGPCIQLCCVSFHAHEYHIYFLSKITSHDINYHIL